jgi:hydroxymethylbilane synthase
MLRIGTRESKLALWQTNLVQSKLTENNIHSVIIPIKSDGDLVLDLPLYELGITGIFTKTLDLALLKNEIDLAVHSLKDVPTLYPKGILPVAYLERENASDILVYKNSFLEKTNRTIATGSLRRKSFWLNKFQTDTVVDLRGNIQTRLKKLVDSNEIDAAIFAFAGLKRCEMFGEIEFLGLKTEFLDWMIPAPAQGTIVVTALHKNQKITNHFKSINHKNTEIEVSVERDFLRTLEGGCTTPLGAKAEIIQNKIKLSVCLMNLDGTKHYATHYFDSIDNYKNFGNIAAQNALKGGAKEIVDEINAQLDGK